MVKNKLMTSMLVVSLMAMPAMVLADLESDWKSVNKKNIIVGTVGAGAILGIGYPTVRYGVPALCSNVKDYVVDPLVGAIGEFAKKAYKNNDESIGKTIWAGSWRTGVVVVPCVVAGGLIYKYHPELRAALIATGNAFLTIGKGAIVKVNSLGKTLCGVGSTIKSWFTPKKQV